MNLLIRNVQIGDSRNDLLVEGNRIAKIAQHIESDKETTVIDGSHFAVFPTFANLHTHAAMTLLRGYGEDIPLQEWLTEWIWPKEKNLDGEKIYWAVRWACIEMIKSGCTAFNDMYFYLSDAAKAVEDSGIRALLCDTQFGDADPYADPTSYKAPEWQSERVKFGLGPHAIYTVSDKGLLRMARFSKENHLPYHIHMSETLTEVEDCIKAHGCRPYEYLDQLGILELTEGLFIGAHSLYLSDAEIELIGKHHCTVVHNPNSNLKLGSGHQFYYSELKEAGACVTLGTDGCSSSNNLDMEEATKMMALLQKGWRKEPTALPVAEAFSVATKNGFKALGIEAGEIKEGMLADFMLVDLDNVAFVPNHNSTSNLIYSAHSDCIDTVICNGEIVMQGRKVKEEDLVREKMRITHL